MKNKGFTLIELLAVIVILAIISLIAVPILLNVVEKSRQGAAIESVNGIISTAEKYYAQKILNNNSYENTIDLTGDILKYKGKKPEVGTLLINEKGKVHVIAKYGKYCIEKKYNDESPKIVNKEECTIDGVVIEEAKIYGIRREINSSQTTWERIEDSVGLNANAQFGINTVVRNDFDVIYPWSDIKSYNYDTTTNQIKAWIGEENFKFDGSNGEVLTKIPSFYYKREQKDGYEYIYITKAAKEGYIKSEEFSVGRYVMSGTGINDVHSRSGYSPLVNKNITNFREYSKSMGPGFGQMDYHYFILQILYLVEYADYNSQAKLGLGYTNSSHTAPINSGGCNELGMNSGTINNDGNHSMIYRGIEDLYGNVWQFIDGINIKNNQTYICYNQNDYEIDKFDGCYQKLGYTNAINSAYISKLGYDSANQMIALPTEASGSSNRNMCDYYWQDRGNRIAIIGGRYGLNSQVGLWAWGVDISSSDYSAVISSRIIKIS